MTTRSVIRSRAEPLPRTAVISTAQPKQPKPPSAGFRRDIEGLRALAVILVVAFHAGIHQFAGGYVGVDVFFVISGFLITSLLIKEYQGTGRISLQDFFARRAKRILPAASVTLAGSAVAAVLFLDPLKAYKALGDLAAATFYVANWRFINQELDYLAADSGHSIALHFWSLSVEEQFYLVWPLIIAVTLGLARAFGRRGVMATLVVLACVTAGSFALGLAMTWSNPSLAYMATFTRAWQFGVGAIFGIIAREYLVWRWGLRGLNRLLLGWAGLMAVLAAAMLYDSRTPFPGWAALLPTVGTLMIIMAGTGGDVRGGVSGLLSGRIVGWIGRISYSLYLWHWPVLIVVAGEDIAAAHPLVRLAAVGLAVGLAAATYYLVERPIIRSGRLFGSRVRAGALATACVVATAGVLGGYGATLRRDLGGAGDKITMSFHEVFGAEQENSGEVIPAPLQASGDKPEPGECLSFRGTAQAENCSFGPIDGTPVVLFGDSHANQWMSAFRELAERRGWRLTVYTQGSCPAASYDTTLNTGNADTCTVWREDRIADIERMRPEYVIVSSLNFYDRTKTQFMEGWRTTMGKLRSSGAEIVYLFDTPFPSDDVPDCVSGAMDDWSKCEFPIRPEFTTHVEWERQMVAENSISTVLDLTNHLCDTTAGKCFAVRNGLMLYRDNSHLTDSAAQVLVTPLERQLDKHGID